MSLVHDPRDTGRLDAASWPILARALVIGIALDIATFDQLPGLSIAIFFVLTVGLTRRTLSHSILDDTLLGAAILFAGAVGVRATPALVTLDLLAAIIVLSIVATSRAGWTFAAMLARTRKLLSAGVGTFAYVSRPLGVALRSERLKHARPILRPILIAAPVIAVFTALLASADRVFGDVIVPGFPRPDAGSLMTQGFIVVCGTLAAAALWLIAASTEDQAAGRGWSGVARPFARVSDWSAVLGSLNAVFAIFVTVQFTVLFGGEGRVRVTPGLTYAEYARSGFFQLIVVAALATVLILTVWDFGTFSTARDYRTFRILVSVMIALTGVILASALKRLALYEDTFGFTLARFSGYVAIILIAVFLAGLTVLVLTDGRALVVPLAAITAALSLLAMNAISPERFVAERNIARYRATGKIDVAYLGYGLDVDAVPSLTALLPQLGAEQRAELRTALCERASELAQAPAGWRSANLARARARAALTASGITPRGCEPTRTS